MAAPTVDISQLVSEVARAVTVSDSAVVLIEGFAARIVAAIAAEDLLDQQAMDAVTAAINAEVAKVKASSDKLGAAVTANTPAT